MIRLLCVGKMKDKSLKNVQDDYLKRLNRLRKVELIELKEGNPQMEDEKIIFDETSRLLKHIKADEFVCLFDLQGTQVDSLEFSKQLDENVKCCAIIGGSMGVDQRLRDRADIILSISRMTFPHLLARIIVLEQMYRAYKIINGQRYHK